MSSSEKWENLQITRDEVRNIAAALKHQQFRSLLVDYVKETHSPEAREQFQKEIIQLEAERGIDCAFVNPLPGFVVKTSQNGVKKTFVNICANDKVGKPTSSPAVTDAGRGLNWTLPYTLTPARHDYDNSRRPCIVYDAVFHSDTLRLTRRNYSFRAFVVDTALNGIQDIFKVQLDLQNVKYPKIHYKGTPTPAVIRTTSKKKVELSEEDKEFQEKFKYPTGLPKQNEPIIQTAKKTASATYATPHYDIKHRSNIDMQEFTNDPHGKMNAATPKELVVTIHLPLLNSTKTVNLNIGTRNLDLLCDEPAKYKLNIHLPYAVSENGTAKFNLDKKVLEVVLPVLSYTKYVPDLVKDDSGVESDSGDHLWPHEEPEAGEERLERVEESFLESDQHYQMPSCEIRRTGSKHLTITLWVKNVDPESVKTKDTEAGVQIKFVSIGSGHFPIHYAFALKFQAKLTEAVVPDPYENSIVLEVELESVADEDSFWIGLNEEELSSKRMIDFPFVEPCQDEPEGETTDDILSQENEFGGVEAEELSPNEEKSDEKLFKFPSLPPPKARTCSEGSGDETVTARRSILKNRMSRSLSESCADDRHSSAVLYTWSDSCISVQDDLDTREKKTVRFSQNIQKQTFRANSSILGQRRKNQKRTRNKRKSLERRMSESENSEEGDEREKWIKRRGKRIENETVLKPVISNKAAETKKAAAKTSENDVGEATNIGSNVDCKVASLERENSVENDASCDEGAAKAASKKAKKTKKRNEIAFKTQFVNELD